MLRAEDCLGIRSAAAVFDLKGELLRYNQPFGEYFSVTETMTLAKILGEDSAQRLLGGVFPDNRSWSGKIDEDFAGWIDCHPISPPGSDGYASNYLIYFDTTGDHLVSIPEEKAIPGRETPVGLPGVPLLQASLQKLATLQERMEEGALFLIAFDDIYRFDHYGGTSKGDKVLAHLLEKLESIRGENDLLSYIGGDRFVLVCSQIHRIHEAQEMAEALLSLNAEPVAVDGELFYINLSIGIAFYPFDSENADELIRLADRAMREAKLHGWNRYALYSQIASDASLEMLEELRKALPEAIERGDLYFLYQPQFCLERHRFVGAEMLARWNHPRYGELSPEIFLPLAEQTGMIRYLTVRALTEAASAFQELDAIGEGGFSLSINLSPSMIFYSDFLENMEFFLQQYQLSSYPLHLEITENIFAHNLQVMRRTLEKIAAMGVKIEIDDYGTGYTSLSTLIDMPVHTLKIDRKYVQNIDRDEKTRTLYRAMIQTAEALGLEVIAEGVEREEERACIERFGKVVVQGWYFARAMPREAMLTLLKESQNSRDL